MATENGFSRSVLSAAFVTLGRRLNEHRQGLADECRATASGFNVFEFIDPTENTLSDILRFLLDPTASHGQGDIFLRALVGRTRPGLLLNFAYATVARESPTYSIKQHRRRIDIVITIDGFTLAIESKKFAGEEKKTDP